MTHPSSESWYDCTQDYQDIIMDTLYANFCRHGHSMGLADQLCSFKQESTQRSQFLRPNIESKNPKPTV